MKATVTLMSFTVALCVTKSDNSQKYIITDHDIVVIKKTFVTGNAHKVSNYN